MAKKAGAKTAEARGRIDATVSGVEITHPERVIDAESRTTKLDLAQYYARVMDALLPDLADRPVAVVRCPDGIAGQTFFQRHPQAALAGRVGSIVDPDDKEPLLCVRHAKDVLTLVQFGVVEIHPWQAHANALDLADRFILDLDPAPDVPFKAVTLAAKLVRMRLDTLGLRSIVKTTGGKGLHVIVPLRPAVAWDKAKAFAKAIADELAESEPEIFIATASKAARTGRIYVDYLRNDRGSTAVGAYCVRARPGLPVAMPLDWSAVNERLKPESFNLGSVKKVVLPAEWRAARRWRQTLDARRLKMAGVEEQGMAQDKKGAESKKVREYRETLHEMARDRAGNRKDLEGKAAKLGVEIYGAERKGRPRTTGNAKPRR